MKKINLLISSCLLSNNVRWDSKIIKIEGVEKLNQYFNLIPICPEVESNLPIPRLPSEIKDNKVINKNDEDITSFFIKGSELAYQKAIKYNVKYALLKDKSPSCGVNLIYDGTFSGKTKKGEGFTTSKLKQLNIKIYNENQIDELIKDILKEN